MARGLKVLVRRGRRWREVDGSARHSGGLLCIPAVQAGLRRPTVTATRIHAQRRRRGRQVEGVEGVSAVVASERGVVRDGVAARVETCPVGLAVLVEFGGRAFVGNGGIGEKKAVAEIEGEIESRGCLGGQGF